ncbi:helix-turn-helix domain-containing protein [Rhizohabitans arisaemae]|uniref:helix-turn-helix domain-containing protein n=1 Tax=Rhizohabitans arisaemae TaxID=2720610 RepID=UPI0024B04CF9|nr:helix-turn-helix domain-containing protein [Rhizohabitans arisaemae]
MHNRDEKVSELAALLHSLKERSSRSYAELAGRCGASTSTLHRYCRGQVLPDSYGMVERIALACGASKAELAELYRLWAQADAGRLDAGRAPVTDDPQLPAVAPAPAASHPRDPVSASAVHGRRPARSGRRTIRFIALACVLAAAMVIGASASSPDRRTSGRPTPQLIPGPAWSQPPAPVPAEFYGVTINSDSGAMPTFRVGGIRLWDSETLWSLLQPARNRFDWTTLDRLVGSARRANLPVLYTFGGTPQWAAPGAPLGPYPGGSRTAPPDDLKDWIRFVKAVATRYAGRIDAYELWAFAPSPHFYTGDAATLARMTQQAAAVIRRADPAATLVCPSIGNLWEQASQRFLRDFAAAGGYQACDVAGVKLAPQHDGDTPESLVRLAAVIDRTFHEAGVHPRLWSTGTVYRIAQDRKLDQARAIAYAVRFYLIGMYVRYDRMYFYNWGGTKIPLVLQAVGGPPTAAAHAVDTLQRWLAGARITSCGNGRPDGLPSQVWQCQFVLAGADGREPVRAIVRWTESGTVSMPADRGADTVRFLDGRSMPAPHTVQITEQPILITIHPGR